VNDYGVNSVSGVSNVTVNWFCKYAVNLAIFLSSYYAVIFLPVHCDFHTGLLTMPITELVYSR